MILRALTVAGGLAGAAGTSQFPEFSQQYMQRLGGAVDALGTVVADFDASAAASDLTREAALEQLQGTEFLERRRADMDLTFTRFDTLTAQLSELETSSSYTRARHAAQADGEIVQATWDAYKPALPLTLEGGVFAGAGFLSGFIVLSGIFAAIGGLVRLTFRRSFS